MIESNMKTIGNLHYIDRKFNFEWRVHSFFLLSDNDENGYCSTPFQFDGESWKLRIYPNGRSRYGCAGYLSVFLDRELRGIPKSLDCTFYLKTTFGQKHEKYFTRTFEEAGGHGFHKFFRRSTLTEKKSELVPFDILTIHCTITFCPKSVLNEGKIKIDIKVPQLFQTSSDIPDAMYILSERKYLNKRIKCQTCTDEAMLGDKFNNNCKATREKGTEKLVDDFTNILRNEQHSDVTIKVKDEEFRLHRCILAGRNPFFNSMFNTEMKEKITGIVSVDDCEPSVFRSFIRFLYTGKVDDLSLENVCDIYKVADMYQEDQLKAECLCYMKNKMSVDTFCDFIILALKHDDRELLQNATQLFNKRIKEIVVSVKWQNFMKNYPTQANELYIKGIDYISQLNKHS